ncbi:uncharacterized protein [Ptychodera flava]|uniref:uncharacterized protein n=1 Tax=Ptychodera flava TaxID=63121 RepID=UPI00396A13CD
MVRRLEPELRHKYDDIIMHQVAKGFISKMDNADNSKGHYLPHHAVRKDSETTPIRIVYDCSCQKSSEQPSLNDCLETGPHLLNDLSAILLRFRAHNVGFTSDIEKAFLHVQLADKDRDYTKFLWISDPDNPESQFETYRFNVVLFGAVCSPFILNSVVKTHLEENPSHVTSDIAKNVYVDNIVSGAVDTKDTMTYYEEANSVMSSGGFRLRSWVSNDEKLNEVAKNDEIAESKGEVSTLGMKWITQSDKLTYVEKNFDEDSPTTKREIVRTTSSIFDPFGYLSPVHVSAKKLIQELWQQKRGWDEQIPEHLEQEWHKIRSNLKDALDIQINRQYIKELTQEKECELHVFSDASQSAYGAAVYIKHGKLTSLVMAKSRVKPLKDISLPCLELMGAVIATRLANHVTNALHGTLSLTKTTVWIDNQAVIHWIVGNKKLPVFVQNRVNEIKKHDFEVKYCPTKDNPADLLTRGITASELRNSDLWWKGPHWLSEGDWPICNIFDSKVLLQHEAINQPDKTSMSTTSPADKTVEFGIHKLIDANRYSSLRKLLHVTAYVLKFTSKLRGSKTSMGNPNISVQDIRDAEALWITGIQAEMYVNEIATLRKTRTMREPLVRQLRLFIDRDGILRLGGRLHNAPINEETKFPILLPRNHAFTRLVIQQAHIRVLHSGMQATVTNIRQRYWIPRIRESVKAVLRKCVKCRKIAGKSYRMQITPPLQSYRVSDTPPFTVTGIDFTGALHVISPTRNSDARNSEDKVYICLFTCASTRAVHLEVVTDLSTKTFLNAFRRFSAGHSLPSKIVSDNASTYMSAADEIRKIVESRQVQRHMINNRVEWLFIPKRAPWFGGFWERLIGLTKTAIKKVLGRARITLDELTTVVAEVETMLNERPLTYVGDDVSLTPSLLLYGRNINTLPLELTDDSEITDPTFTVSTREYRSDLENRARHLAKLKNHFWRRWYTEYLPALHERHYVKGKAGNAIKTGDVVIVHSDDKHRLNWNLAVVEELKYGHDGLVRSATIRTKQGNTTRPISKLYPLELSCKSDRTSADVVEDNTRTDLQETDVPNVKGRSMRKSAVKARENIKQWTQSLSDQ